MEHIWQQHRTFILKILAGVFVVLVIWIAGESMTDQSVSSMAQANEGVRRGVSRGEVPADSDTAKIEAAVREMEDQLLFVAQKVGETRKGEELRRAVIARILEQMGENTAENRNLALKATRQGVNVVVPRLVGEALAYLDNQARLAGVIFTDSLGFDKSELEPGELDRYLLTLDLILRVARLAIEEGVTEVKTIGVSTPGGGRFREEEGFIRECPFNFEVRGPSESVLRFLERLNDPEHFIVVKNLTRMERDRGVRDENSITARIEMTGLRIDTDAKGEE